MSPRLTAQRLVALFVAGALLLNFPLLRLWSGSGTWFGLPWGPLALFLLWLGLIIALAVVMERSAPDDGSPAGATDSNSADGDAQSADRE